MLAAFKQTPNVKYKEVDKDARAPQYQPLFLVKQRDQKMALSTSPGRSGYAFQTAQPLDIDRVRSLVPEELEIISIVAW